MSAAEKRALWALAFVAAGFLPPVTLVTGRPAPFVFGVPFNFLWLAVMIAGTAIALTLAYRHVARHDGFDAEPPAPHDPESGPP